MVEVRKKFAQLHNYGTKLYKFQQRKAFNEITEENFPEDYERVSHGMCVGATLAWLKERILTSNSWTQRAGAALHLRKQPEAKFLPNGTNPSQVHTRNVGTLREAGALQIAYSKMGYKEAFRAHGMQEFPGVQSVGAMKLTPDSEGRPQIANLAAAMTDACAVERLSPGRGVLFNFSVYHKDTNNHLGGHNVAAYRSHGNTLYFFDANIGVYQVRDTANFMQAWVDGCRTGRDWKIEVDLVDLRKRDGWIYVVSNATP